MATQLRLSTMVLRDVMSAIYLAFGWFWLAHSFTAPQTPWWNSLWLIAYFGLSLFGACADLVISRGLPLHQRAVPAFFAAVAFLSGIVVPIVATGRAW